MGVDWAKFFHIAAYVAGPALTAVGVPGELVPVIVHGMLSAEQAVTSTGTPKTGPEKKAMVMDAVQTAITGVNVVAPGKIDPNVIGVVDRGIDVTIDAINALHKTSNKG